MCLRFVDVSIWLVKKLLVELQTIHIDLGQAILFALSDLGHTICTDTLLLVTGIIIFRITL